MSLFRFEHVTKRYTDGDRVCAVLEDVSFEVDVGDFIGIWGKRRSGKSTLLRIAAGFEPPDEGQIFFDGNDLAALSGDERAELMRMEGIGFVASDWRPIVSQEAIDYVALPLLAGGLNLRRARRIAQEHLEQMGVSSCAHMLIERLSIGEAMRVRLACALAREPRLLLVDEPAALPIPSERDDLRVVLRSLGKSRELALVMASEDLGAVAYSRRTMTIGLGSLDSTDKEGEVVSLPVGRRPD